MSLQLKTLGRSHYSSARAVRMCCTRAQQIVVVQEKPLGPRQAQPVARHYRDIVTSSPSPAHNCFVGLRGETRQGVSVWPWRVGRPG